MSNTIGLMYVADPLNADNSISAHLTALAGQSGSIIFLNGTYELKKPIVLSTGISLVGATGTILKWDDSIGSDPGPMIVLDSWCSVSAMTLEGGSRVNSIGITVKPACSHYNCDSVRVFHFEHGFEFENSYVGLFTNCVSYYNRSSGIHYKGIYVMDHRYIGGELAGNPIGFLVDGGQHYGHTISMVIEGNSVCGIQIDGAIYNFKVKDCYFELNCPNAPANGTQRGGFDINVPGYTMGMVVDGNVFFRSGVGVFINGRVFQAGAKSTHIVNNSFFCEEPWRIGNCAVDTHIGWNYLGTSLSAGFVPANTYSQGYRTTHYDQGWSTSSAAPVTSLVTPKSVLLASKQTVENSIDEIHFIRMFKARLAACPTRTSRPPEPAPKSSAKISSAPPAVPK